MGKNFCVTVPTGKIKAKSPEQQLEEELKRHFNGIVSAMVKWSKIIDESKANKKSEHEDPHPQDQVAAESTSSLEGNTE